MIYGEKINLSKIGIERKLLNLIKEICKKPIAKNCFIVRSYIFPPNIRNKDALSPFLYDFVPKSLAIAIIQEK